MCVIRYLESIVLWRSFQNTQYLYPSTSPAVENRMLGCVFWRKKSPQVFLAECSACSEHLEKHQWERNSILLYPCWPEADILPRTHTATEIYFKTVQKNFHMYYLLFPSYWRCRIILFEQMWNNSAERVNGLLQIMRRKGGIRFLRGKPYVLVST